MNIIVMGPQGSGKSTQAKRLANNLDLLYVSTGEILRELVEVRDPQGAKAEQYMLKGELVPDSLINDILASWLDFQKSANGFVLDGYPRSVSQAKILEEKILGGQKIDIVFYIDIPTKEILSRLAKREKLEHRPDETPKAIAERLDEYQKYTTPVLDFYRKRGILIKIDGTESVDAVYRSIISQISKLKSFKSFEL